MKVESWDVGRVKPYANNPRKNEKAIAPVAESIRRFGFNQPIVVDAEGVIVVGDTRHKAALKLGLKKVPVLVASGLSPEQARAYRVADNRTGELADWDFEKLLEELRAGGDPADWMSLGFSEGELEELLLIPGQTSPDQVPAPAEFVTSRIGDLWTLGEHRLLCGDSTQAEDVGRLMGDELAALVATDPPYLVNYTGNRPCGSGKDWSDKYVEVDSSRGYEFYRDLFLAAMEHAGESVAVYCWHAHPWTKVIETAWAEAGILAHQLIIWAKPTCVLCHTMWLLRHEPCIMGWRQGTRPRAHGWANGDSVWGEDGRLGIEDLSREELIELVRAQTDLWTVDWEGKARATNAEHPTQKPVEIFTRPMRRHTIPGDVVYEPFSGSGTQLIAAEMIGRRCRAMEISPPFVDVAIRRWQLYTGAEAVLEDGSTYAQVRKQRRASEKRKASRAASS